jgi:hypothetical protein
MEKSVPRGQRYRHQNLLRTKPRAKMPRKITKMKRLTLKRGRGISERTWGFRGRII